MKCSPPVAVLGAGCLSAAGRTPAENTASMLSGCRNPTPPTRFNSGHQVRYPVFELPDAWLPWADVRGMGILLTAALALAAARDALTDAGLETGDLKGGRVGVAVGTTVGSAMNNEDFYRDYRSGNKPDMAPIRRFLGSNPAAVIRGAFNLSGPCQTVVNACSSGSDAIGIAAGWLRRGICDLALAGGADELCRVTYNGFISLMISDENPCRPFDRRRRGLNLGEGAAMLLLAAPGTARIGGNGPKGLVLGYGAAQDAHHLTAPHPSGEGLRRALAQAFDQSGLRARDIAFVNAHGTGTPDNDRVEGRVLADLLPGVPFVSTKAYTGHTLGAAGAIEAALTVAHLAQGVIPGTAGFADADEDLNGAAPAAAATAVSGAAAVSQSLAFGGNNAVLIFGKA